MSSNYIKLDFHFDKYNKDAADLLAAFLADSGFESFEDSDNGLTAYVQEEHFIESDVNEIVQNFPITIRISFSKTIIPQKNWNEEWEKNYFQPLLLADGKCVIHATFHTDYPPAPYNITIDPRMAFGTGHHATTSMMINHLFASNPEGKDVIDMGTGTGILAILSKKLGAKNVTAIEIDRIPFENAIDNATLNNVHINLLHGDTTTLSSLQPVDIFLANINRNIILEDLNKYVKVLRKNAVLVLSGFYETDVPVLEKALHENGMKIDRTLTEKDSWCSIMASF